MATERWNDVYCERRLSAVQYGQLILYKFYHNSHDNETKLIHARENENNLILYSLF